MTQTENRLPVTFSGLKALREFMSNYDGSWRDLAWEFNGRVSISTLRRIAGGHYIPKRPQTLRDLHLPLTVAVAVCSRHGVVHISRRCPPDNPKPRRPTKAARRKRLVHDKRWRSACARMVKRR